MSTHRPEPAEASLTPRLITVKDAAKLLGVSPYKAYQLVKSGQLEARYIGTRNLRVTVSAVDAYIASLPTTEPTDAA